MADRFANQWRIPVPAPPVVVRELQVTAPASGDTLTVGKPVAITWVNSDGSAQTGTVTILVGRDVGLASESWTPILSDAQNSGAHNWTVTAPATTAARFRITTNVGTAESGGVVIILVAPPPPPPTTEDLTLASLIDEVFLRLGDYVVYETFTWTSDGGKFARLYHGNLVENSFAMISGPVGYTVEENAGYLLWTENVPVGVEVNCSYAYHAWSSDVVRAFLEASISAMWPEFYCIAETALPIVSGTYEYEVRDSAGRLAEAITDVCLVTDGYPLELDKDEYKVIRKEGYAAFVKLDFEPGDGSYLVRYVTRPGQFTADTVTLSQVGLPERAAEPMVYYALWQCLAQQVALRTRNDRAIASDGLPSGLDLIRNAQLYQLLFTQSLAKNRMRSWTARGI